MKKRLQNSEKRIIEKDGMHMKQFSYCIQDKNGMHARPAGALANCAKRYTSSIKVSANGKSADAKRLLSLMSLGAVYGSELTFCIEGEDEALAAEMLRAFCQNGFQPVSSSDKE